MKRRTDATPQEPKPFPIIALRPDEAAASIGVSKSTIYELIKAGKIKTGRPTEGIVIIPVDELKRYVASLVA